MQSISQRITAILALMTLLGAAITIVTVAEVVHHEMDELLDQGLRESADLIHNIMARAPSADAITDATQVRDPYEEHLVWQVLDVDTLEVVARSARAPAKPLHTRHERELFDLDGQRAGEHWRVITLPLETGPKAPGDARRHLLVVAQSHAERVEARAEATEYAAVASLIGAVLTTALTYLLIRRELLRLRRLSSAVAHYDPLQPEARLPPVDRRELESIVEAVNGLGQRLAQRVVSERAFTAHAAHALRTPLAGLDVQLAMAVRQAPDEATRLRLEQARSATGRLSRVVHALLAMFRSGLEPAAVPTDPRELLRCITVPGLEVAATGPAVRVDADLFAAVMMNLLDNSQRHGASRVTVTSRASGAGFEVTVEDDGEGCPPERLQHMQAALDRQDYRSGGGLTGLGLILADLVMRAHAGRVELLPRATAPSGMQGAHPGFALRLVWP